MRPNLQSTYTACFISKPHNRLLISSIFTLQFNYQNVNVTRQLVPLARNMPAKLFASLFHRRWFIGAQVFMLCFLQSAYFLIHGSENCYQQQLALQCLPKWI